MMMQHQYGQAELKCAEVDNRACTQNQNESVVREPVAVCTVMCTLGRLQSAESINNIMFPPSQSVFPAAAVLLERCKYVGCMYWMMSTDV